jgi:NAD(P)-dependent dehydrogenase (short-subunit alcohol dehydrogenase family)
MATNAVLVTGASGALGSALVAELLRSNVVVAVGRGVTQADVDAAHGKGRVVAAAFDVTHRDEWVRLLEQTERDGLALTGAVLAAGAYRGGEPLHRTKDEGVWSAMMAANLETAGASLTALLPGMVTRKQGSVVLIGSLAAVRPWTSAGSAAYAASKAAVTALVQATAAEVLADSVRVNALLPSTIDTPANRAGMPNADASRWVAPASIAGVAAFLLSEAARDISGALLPVYGRVGV